jgi:ectoine hydroxylase-related dioxygenase (phytanoyl-CoA dioxygenase family)
MDLPAVPLAKPNTATTTAQFDLCTDSFDQMADFFYANGYVILNNALDADMVRRIRHDLHTCNDQMNSSKTNKVRTKDEKNKRHNMCKCFFEHSPATVDLIEHSKLTDFAQHVIADVPGARPDSNSLTAHVIHNNAFIVPPGGRGQAPSWHVDDPLQQVIVPDGTTLPANIRLPVLVCTYMIWLSDCDTAENGPTYVVPGSHRYGRPVDGAEADRTGIPMCGKAGTAVLINSNVWHRGCNNQSDVSRETLQITFGRRIIGHKHKTIMNYQMPEHVYSGRSEPLKARMGFLEGGAYS